MKPPTLGAAASSPRLLAQRLVALFLAGLLLLNFPLLVPALADDATGAATSWLGLPRLPLLLFAAFVLLIALLAVLMERDDRAERPQPD